MQMLLKTAVGIVAWLVVSRAASVYAQALAYPDPRASAPERADATADRGFASADQAGASRSAANNSGQGVAPPRQTVTATQLPPSTGLWAFSFPAAGVGGDASRQWPWDYRSGVSGSPSGVSAGLGAATYNGRRPAIRDIRRSTAVAGSRRRPAFQHVPGSPYP